jgi:nucleoredoxin
MRVALTIAVLVAALVTAATFVHSKPARDKVPISHPVETIFAGGLLDASGGTVNPEMLKGKIVGVYFSAHWCPPCRLFSPQLVKFRDENQAGFEVVFVSLDNSEKDQIAYMKELEMKWPAVKHGSRLANSLTERFGVEGIPTLVILAPDGSEITREGRFDVIDHPGTALARWKGLDVAAAK